MTTNKNQSGNYARVNGLDLYYELHGSGQPLVVLPGSFGTIEALGEIVPLLAKKRQVIAVELQGHGHTADIDRQLSYEALADDIAALIASLGLQQADLFGYSLGGGVALQTAIRHPKVVRKLAVASAPFKRDGRYPEDLEAMNAISPEAFAGTPIHEAYLRTSPLPEAWPTVVAKVRQMVTSDYDWSADVAALKTPTLIVVGDADGLRLPHMLEFFALLGGGQGDGDLSGLPRSSLAVLPATTHVGWAPPYHGIMTRTHLLLPILTEFFDAPLPAS
ncbi:alpha/beta hydrolase [Ktedonosporobacter rubrisoli]|uniref:Alpha/beta hydrolase n=1 Tax=Ktedonosporobacter rubrisoli TaxID=2509675 RepID=A0A4P6JMA1_KTERU|nr:alpha/beta hydrolase [Ktedonosporobacter rubrisoli]QBD76142.1 alpha/beta hydrolase [Ktedonosporobacter rubrisoli]